MSGFLNESSPAKYTYSYLEEQKELWHTPSHARRRSLKSNEGIRLSKKAFHIWLWLFILPLCYTIISTCYYLVVWFG